MRTVEISHESDVTLTPNTTRETMTTTTEIQHKTIEGLCAFGRVVGVIM